VPPKLGVRGTSGSVDNFLSATGVPRTGLAAGLFPLVGRLLRPVSRERVLRIGFADACGALAREPRRAESGAEDRGGRFAPRPATGPPATTSVSGRFLPEQRSR